MELQPAPNDGRAMVQRAAAPADFGAPAGYNRGPHTLPELRCFPVPT